MENEPVRDGITFTHEINLEVEHPSRPEVISLLSDDASVSSAQRTQQTKVEDDIISDIKPKCFTADSLESMRSGESVFKLFTFDPEKCTANVDKCMAFWQKIDEMDLKPVNCSLYKPKRKEQPKEMGDEQGEEPIVEEIGSEMETTETMTNTAEEVHISWCEALQELKKRNLDKVAKVAKPLRCKMCKALSFELDFEQDQQFDQHEEIVALNNWNPQQIKKTQKDVVVKKPSKEAAVDCTKQKTTVEGTEIKNKPSLVGAKDKKIIESTKAEQKIKQPIVETKDKKVKKSTKEVEQKIKQPIVEPKDEKVNESTKEIEITIKQPIVEAKESKIKQPIVATKDEEFKKSITIQPVATTKDQTIEEAELKIKISDVEMKEVVKEEKTKKASVELVMEHFDSENQTKESCLNLMENLFKDVLEKMSEEIDAHVNVKELVSEMITTAMEKIKAKKDKTPKKREEKQYETPPYSKTGDYRCVCREFGCKCNTPQKTTVEVIKSAKVAKKHNLIKQLNKISISTQFPEEVETIIQTSADRMKGGFCKICGLPECVCKYIRDNRDSDAFTRSSSS